MKLIYRLPFILLMMFTFVQASAQSNRMYSQYMFNGLLINPAYAGNQYELSVTALNRAQWTGIKGAPVSQTLSAHYRSKEKNTALGIVANHDQIGIHDNTQVLGVYSYHIKLKSYALSFGLQGGFESLRANWNRLNVNDPGDPLLSGLSNQIKPNVGAGIFVYNGKGYIGFSVPAIIENYGKRYYILTGAKLFPVSSQFSIKPSFLVRYNAGAPVSYDISNTFIFNSRIFAGMSLRSGNALSWLLEFQLNENFRFGYAFDHSFNALDAYGTGTHEIMLNYRINLSNAPCHTFY